MSGLADRLTADGSIESLDAAAPWRIADAMTLESAGRPTAAVYLDGYPAELRLTACCYRLLGFTDGRIIDRAERAALGREARKLNLMSAEPHHLVGWSRYLVYLRKRERTGFARNFREDLLARVADLYDNWRPRLRYRAILPPAAQLTVVRESATWLDERYAALWG